LWAAMRLVCWAGIKITRNKKPVIHYNIVALELLLLCRSVDRCWMKSAAFCNVILKSLVEKSCTGVSCPRFH
jgi:hypothetical protein